METIEQIFLFFGYFLGTILLLVVASLLFLSRSHTPKIKGKNSIASLEEIDLGEIRQTILIRSKDVANPILLFLHGGPGSSLMPFAHVSDRKLEEKFIVVHWDQRGAGKSYTKNMSPADLTIEQYLSDTQELINYLRNRFGKEKVFLLGHSWGSYLGIMTAHRHPKLLHAYIGMGQVINMQEGETISYNYVLKKAHMAGNQKAIADLQRIGLPPHDNYQELLTERNWLTSYRGLIRNRSLFRTITDALFSPEYSIWDHFNEFKGRDFSLSCVWGDFQTVSIDETINELEIPVYFLEGRYDYCVPSVLVEQYLNKLKAPHKEIIWFENSAHVINIEETSRYQSILMRVAFRCKRYIRSLPLPPTA
ncbi:MAG: alpha/beta fold hydrolase [Bacteroidota bacterium]